MKRLSLLVLAFAVFAPAGASAMGSSRTFRDSDMDEAAAPEPEELDLAQNDDWNVEAEAAEEPAAAAAPPEREITAAEAKSGITPEWDRYYRKLSDYCIRYPGECVDDSEYAAVPQIYKHEALRRFAFSPYAVSFAVSKQEVDVSKAPKQDDANHKTIEFDKVYETEWEEDGIKAVLSRKGSMYAKPWDNFEPFEVDMAKVDFEGPYLNEMKPPAGDLNPEEEGTVRFKTRVPREGFEFVRPITRPVARAMVGELVGEPEKPRDGKVVVYRKTLIKPVVNVGVYSE